MTRLRPRCPENAHFLDYVRISYLLKCKKSLPQSVLDKSWPTPPGALVEVSDLELYIFTIAPMLLFWIISQKSL